MKYYNVIVEIYLVKILNLNNDPRNLIKQITNYGLDIKKTKNDNGNKYDSLFSGVEEII